MMKYTPAMLLRQKQEAVQRRLPPIFRERGGPISFDSTLISPQNAENFFNFDGWEECSCFVRGLLVIWQIFFVLFKKHRFPLFPLPDAFVEDHPMDSVECLNGVWLHESAITCCAPCLERLKKIFALLSQAFLPTLRLYDWSAHRLRIVLFTESFWDAEVSTNLEIGVILRGALLTILLSGTRSVIYRLFAARGADLCLLQSLPIMKQFCDVVGGDVLEGNFFQFPSSQPAVTLGNCFYCLIAVFLHLVRPLALCSLLDLTGGGFLFLLKALRAVAVRPDVVVVH